MHLTDCGIALCKFQAEETAIARALWKLGYGKGSLSRGFPTYSRRFEQGKVGSVTSIKPFQTPKRYAEADDSKASTASTSSFQSIDSSSLGDSEYYWLGLCEGFHAYTENEMRIQFLSECCVQSAPVHSIADCWSACSQDQPNWSQQYFGTLSLSNR